MTSNKNMAVDDYLTNKYFKPIYEYLALDKLTGNSDTNQEIILMSKNYYHESSLMYKVTLTRGRKKRIALSHHQLCVPKK